MSNVYNLEPQPTAKVVLQTTSGDITIELFAKQTPLASRNFLQHCLDGYYNNTIFHRLVPGFILQGGDPTGSGSGGISALNGGDNFQDEFHSRLKYNRRGLLGMANEGKDSNASQFFFTLAATPELQGRNTLFGRVEGDTIYNLMRMADAELVEGEGSERPLYPTKITGAEIIVNPFEDMVARAQIAPRATADDGQKKKDLKKRKKPAGKNVLSFGGDDGDDSLAPVVKKAKVNPKFAASVDDGPSDKIIKPVVHREQTKDTTSLPKRNETVNAAEAVRDTETPDRVANRETLGAQQPVSAAKPDMEMDDEDEDERGERESKRARAAALALEKTKAEFDALKKSMKRSNEVQAPSKEKPRSALEAMIPETSTRGRKRGGKGGNDEQGALDLFKAFKERLEGLPAIEDIRIDHSDKSQASKEDIAGTQDGGMKKSGVATEINDDEEAILCDLHFIPNCQSCKSWDTGDDVADGDKDEQGTDWMAHKLSFAKDTLGKDLEWKRKMQEIEVIDPREKTREILGERKKGKEKSRAR
ncbi:cyclophilin-like protein [Dissoconium aciculare CBS 342.82]|uniref:Cyclophilin-like protein n=1 Tax=Dissoconium aciculare CBS 342.82 TaxID=1314786 RepID=A0A6J3M4B3_9PEZI|nr:cyclophilin-like protein [Dissoconium aciculare CBS 342.82]KAF1822865.1 cyclophilin-like protein [Dissoconium aciculare CBS 342.82]